MHPLFFSLLVAAVDPSARCAGFGDAALVGDLDTYKKVFWFVCADAPPCVLFHAAMAKARLADKGGAAYLRQAIQLLSRIGDEADAPVREWARVRQLELALRLKAPELAPDPAEVPAALPNPEQHWQMTTALVGDSDPDKALALHAAHPLPRGRDRLLQIADMVPLLKADDPRMAPLLTELYRDYPDASVSPREWPKKLGDLPLQTLLDRLSLQHSHHANNSVIQQVNRALASVLDGTARCQMLYYKGAALRKLHAYAPAERALQEAVSVCADVQAAAPEAYKRAWFVLGQVQSIMRPFPIANATLSAFATQFKDDPLADDALWFAVTSAEKAGDTDAASEVMARIVKEHSDGDMCAEASFRAAFDSYHANAFTTAAVSFARMVGGPCKQDDMLVARASYWQSRALARAHADKSEERAALVAAYSASPLTYYGMLARLRLGKDLPVLPEPMPASAPVVVASDDQGPPLSASRPVVTLPTERIRILSEQGLFAEAQAELQAVHATDLDASQTVALALLQDRAHDFHHSHRHFRTSLRPQLGLVPSADNAALWHTAYPRPYEAYVSKSEKEEKLPRDLLLSLIREESAFQVDAGSWANAYGLSQLLVETAARVARDAKIDKEITADLLRKQGAVSIQLGGHLLGMLQKRYRSVPLMLAAYNAGEEAVDRWLSARGQLPLDEFVETIPFDETRDYVKRILSTWWSYRALSERHDLPAVSIGRAQQVPLQMAENP